ncbi:MAG: hypothetical protein K0M40_21805 [Prolixibacteraceae bacterium]|nr:hypothetical protein [Prolixibacteraceae bacterium]
MKTTSALTKILLGLIFVLLMCLFLDFLALHDIRNDYVSNLVITRFSPKTLSVLPVWSGTMGEWTIVEVSFLIKLIVVGLTIIISWVLHRRIRLMQ